MRLRSRARVAQCFHGGEGKKKTRKKERRKGKKNKPPATTYRARPPPPNDRIWTCLFYFCIYSLILPFGGYVLVHKTRVSCRARLRRTTQCPRVPDAGSPRRFSSPGRVEGAEQTTVGRSVGRSFGGGAAAGRTTFSKDDPLYADRRPTTPPPYSHRTTVILTTAFTAGDNRI